MLEKKHMLELVSDLKKEEMKVFIHLIQNSFNQFIDTIENGNEKSEAIEIDSPFSYMFEDIYVSLKVLEKFTKALRQINDEMTIGRKVNQN